MNDLLNAGQAFIAAMEKKLLEQEEAVVQTKKFINTLLEQMGQPARFADLASPTASTGPMRGDEYYGKSMSTAAREVLERRHAVGAGPATINEIHAVMKEGGYQSEAKNEDIERQGLRNLMIKNSGIFHKLPSGKYGLLTWYPGVKEKKPAPKDAAGQPGSPAAAKTAEAETADEDNAANEEE
jgi:hypothetical protein